MKAGRRFGACVVAATIALLVLAGCGDDKKESTSSSTTAAGARTVNGCVIQPGTSCPGANLSNHDLQGVNLTGANLSTANLSQSNLSNANLSGANLTGANLRGVTMISTNLSSANLTDANFTGGNLDKVNLTNATHCGTIRTDGTTDNTSCPKPSTTTARATTTTVAVQPPPCSTDIFLQIIVPEKPGMTGTTSIGPPVCEALYAVQPIKTPDGRDQMALFHVGADADTWVNIAIVPVGDLPPSVAAMCGSLPGRIGGMIGCPSG